jgi:RNA polymerase sporulation-specific sigma factor
MKNYDTLSDATLLSLLREGDFLAERTLYDRFKPVVRACARAYFLQGGEMEDLNQEGMIGLYHAVKEFDASKGSSFKTFAELCIKRQLITAVKLYNRKKHAPLNAALSIEREEDSAYWQIQIGDPEREFLNREQQLGLKEFLELELSLLEKRVLKLYFEGLSYDEIAFETQKPVKSIDNALSRVRKKLRKYKFFDE